VPAMKLQYAWMDCNFSFTYEVTIDVWCVANKTLVYATKVKVTVRVQTNLMLIYK
jgi:hypothetical protein